MNQWWVKYVSIWFASSARNFRFITLRLYKNCGIWAKTRGQFQKYSGVAVTTQFTNSLHLSLSPNPPLSTYLFALSTKMLKKSTCHNRTESRDRVQFKRFPQHVLQVLKKLIHEIWNRLYTNYIREMGLKVIQEESQNISRHRVFTTNPPLNKNNQLNKRKT